MATRSTRSHILDPRRRLRAGPATPAWTSTSRRSRSSDVAGRLVDRAELLAHHYGQALELSRAAGSEAVDALGVSTRRALMMAGENAMTLDISRATVCFDEVLALLPAVHPERASALYFRAEAVKDSGRYEEAERGLSGSDRGVPRDRRDGVGEGAGLTKLANVLWERGALAECRERLAEGAMILESEPPGVDLATCFVFVALGSDRRGVLHGGDRLVRPFARAGDQTRGRVARVARAQLPGGRPMLLGRRRRPPRSAAGSGSRSSQAAGPSRRSPCSFAPRWNGRRRDRWSALETVREGGGSR